MTITVDDIDIVKMRYRNIVFKMFGYQFNLRSNSEMCKDGVNCIQLWLMHTNRDKSFTYELLDFCWQDWDQTCFDNRKDFRNDLIDKEYFFHALFSLPMDLKFERFSKYLLKTEGVADV